MYSLQSNGKYTTDLSYVQLCVNKCSLGGAACINNNGNGQRVVTRVNCVA